jgi:hypothetical protein
MSLSDPVIPSEAAMRQIRRMADRDRATMSNLRSRLATFGVRRHQAAYLPPALVRFKNDASESAPRWGVMRVTGANYDGKYITTAKPNATLQRLYLVNVEGAVDAGKFGWGAYLTAETSSFDSHYVLYDTGNTPAYGESWGPQNNTWTIKKDHPGFLIQGGNTGTGATSRTIAIQDVPQHVFGKADAAIANAASGTVRIYGGTQGSETDTGLTIASCYNYGPDIADEANVWVGWLGGKAYVQNMECV